MHSRLKVLPPCTSLWFWVTLQANLSVHPQTRTCNRFHVRLIASPPWQCFSLVLITRVQPIVLAVHCVHYIFCQLSLCVRVFTKKICMCACCELVSVLCFSTKLFLVMTRKIFVEFFLLKKTKPAWPYRWQFEIFHTRVLKDQSHGAAVIATGPFNRFAAPDMTRNFAAAYA